MARKRQKEVLTPGGALAALLPLSAGILLLDPFRRPLPYLLETAGGAAWAALSIGPPPPVSWAALLPALGGSAGGAAAAFLGGVDPGRIFLEISSRAVPLCFLWTWIFSVLPLPALAGWLRANTGLRTLPELLVAIYRMLSILAGEARSKRMAIQARAPRLQRGSRTRILLHLAAALAGNTARRAIRTGRAMDARGYRGELPFPEGGARRPGTLHLAAGIFFLLLLLAGLSW